MDGIPPNSIYVHVYIYRQDPGWNCYLSFFTNLFHRIDVLQHLKHYSGTKVRLSLLHICFITLDQLNLTHPIEPIIL